MKPRVAPLSLMVALLASPVFAQAPPTPEGPNGRYQFQPVEGGLARLDTATGEVAVCRIDPVRMACDFDAAPPAAGVAPIPPRASAEASDEAEFERSLERMKRVFRAFGDIARDLEAPPPAMPDRT